MARDYELDRIKSEEQAAFARKQDAWNDYQEARRNADEAHDEMQEAWQERCSARDEMNREFEDLNSQRDNRQSIWDEYGRIRDYNNSRIDSLRAEADYEHQEMQRCFDEASSEYEYGDKSLAPEYAAEGREHKERRDDLNAQIRELIDEIKEAKNNAEWRAPRIDSSAYQAAKSRFESAKSRHESAEERFKRCKAERDQKKALFDSLQAEHVRLKEEFQRKLEEVRATRQRERDRDLDRAGIRWSDRQDAKIVKKTDGTTQVYSGGLGSGDGYGHGHVAIDSSGKVVYERGAFEEHGKQNYKTIDDYGFSGNGIIRNNNKSKKQRDGFTIYDRNARSNHTTFGGGEKNRIDVRTGVGHTTQWYPDGYRVSWDTKDGGKTEKAHWTNQNIRKGKKNDDIRHTPPSDATV